MINYCCPQCGSPNVTKETSHKWDVEKQEWVVDSSSYFCSKCGDSFKSLEEWKLPRQDHLRSPYI